MQEIKKTAPKERNRFSFETDLNISIYHELNKIIVKNPNAFVYRKKNLKHVVARSAFYEIVNHRDVLSLYLYGPIQTKKETLYVSKNLYKLIILNLCNLTDKSLSIKVAMAGKIKNDILYTISKIKNYFVGDSKKSFNRSGSDSTLILIAISSKKFSRHLGPLINGLNVLFAYYQHQPKDSNSSDSINLGLTNRDINYTVSVDYIDKEMKEFSTLILLGEKFYQTLLRLSPKVILLSERNSPEDELISQIANLLSIPTICIQHGWNPVIHCGFQNLSYTSFVTWGREFQNLLQKHSPNQEFNICGHHGLRSGSSKDQHAIGFFLQSPQRFISYHQWQVMIGLIEDTAKSYPDQNIIVREHPDHSLNSEERTRITKYSNIRISSPYDTDLDNDLQQCLVSVSIFSSVLLESLAKGVIPIIFNITDMPKYLPDLEFLNCGFEVKSVSEAKEALAILISKPHSRKNILDSIEINRDRYFIALGDTAVSKISNHIESFL